MINIFLHSFQIILSKKKISETFFIFLESSETHFHLVASKIGEKLNNFVILCPFSHYFKNIDHNIQFCSRLDENAFQKILRKWKKIQKQKNIKKNFIKIGAK